jgi:hypothetical protein
MVAAGADQGFPETKLRRTAMTVLGESESLFVLEDGLSVTPLEFSTSRSRPTERLNQ